MVSRIVAVVLLGLIFLSFGCENQTEVEVEKKKPSIKTLSISDSVVYSLDKTTITCNIDSTNKGELMVLWSSNGGNISGEGRSIIWTSPYESGNIKVSCTLIQNNQVIDTTSITIQVKFKLSSNKLIAHYNLDGNAYENSGNLNEGTVRGTKPVADRFENPNSALSFDGIDDYINLGNNQKLKPKLPISISVWVKLDSLNDHSGLFLSSYATNHYYGAFLFVHKNGKVWLNIGNGRVVDPDARRTKEGTTNIELNKWYHIVGIIKENLEMEIYINGKNDGGKYSGTATTMINSIGNGNIGRIDNSIHTPPSYLDGTIDDVYFLNRLLTSYEINELSKR